MQFQQNQQLGTERPPSLRPQVRRKERSEKARKQGVLLRKSAGEVEIQQFLAGFHRSRTAESGIAKEVG